ncbi:MAG: neutral zinc metallopeptidase [Thermomicrobiales bacterium]
MIWTVALLLPFAAGVSAQTPTPTPGATGYRVDSQASSYQGAFADLAADIDAFWAETFAAAGVTYRSPAIVTVERRIETACGPVEPIPNALYCPGDRAIYLMPEFLTDLETRVGDYAPMTVLGHEWGHHVQNLTDAPFDDSQSFELQADCLAGVFTRYAREHDLLDAGDILEALDTSQAAGDPIGLPVDDPGAHGTPEDRVLALTEGYWLGPVAGCGLPLGHAPSAPVPAPETEVVAHAPGIAQPILLRALPLPRPTCFKVMDGGPLDLDELADRFPDPADARAQLQAWGWQASAYREFSCDAAGHDETRWFDVSVHRFGAANDAAAAASYFAAARAEALGMEPATAPHLGDRAVALASTGGGDADVTLYVSQGPILIRVTGISEAGDPAGDVAAVARGLLAAQPAAVGAGQTPPDDAPAGNISAAFLPVELSTPAAACLQQDDRGAYRFQNVADKLDAQGLSAAEIDAVGWRDGAFAIYSCDDPADDELAYLDVVIHSFASEALAREAAPFVTAFYEPGEHEARACDVAGLLVICVDGRAEDGAPNDAVDAVLAQTLAGA